MPFDAHLRLVEEDAAEMVAVGEDLGLVRQVGAAAVDQIDARQPVLARRSPARAGASSPSADSRCRPSPSRRCRRSSPAGPRRGRCRRSCPRRAPRRRTCRRRRAGRSRGTASRDRAAARRGRAAAACRARHGARGASRCRRAPPRRRRRAVSRPARGCARRGRGTRRCPARSCVSMRGALMPCVRPLVENPCRPPSRCGSALQSGGADRRSANETCASNRSLLLLRSALALDRRPATAARQQETRPGRRRPQGTELGIDLASMDKSRQARRRLLRLRQRQLGQEHRNPGRPLERSAASSSPTRSARRTRRELLDEILQVESDAGSERGADRQLLQRLSRTPTRSTSAGMAPVKADLDAIDAIADKSALARAIGAHAPRRHRSAQRDQLSAPRICSACSSRRGSRRRASSCPT